jgi:hypothetical protein
VTRRVMIIASIGLVSGKRARGVVVDVCGAEELVVVTPASTCKAIPAIGDSSATSTGFEATKDCWRDTHTLQNHLYASDLSETADAHREWDRRPGGVGPKRGDDVAADMIVRPIDVHNVVGRQARNGDGEHAGHKLPCRPVVEHVSRQRRPCAEVLAPSVTGL